VLDAPGDPVTSRRTTFGHGVGVLGKVSEGPVCSVWVIFEAVRFIVAVLLNVGDHRGPAPGLLDVWMTTSKVEFFFVSCFDRVLEATGEVDMVHAVTMLFSGNDSTREFADSANEVVEVIEVKVGTRIGEENIFCAKAKRHVVTFEVGEGSWGVVLL